MVLSMEKWVGKIAIVTGASSGIGAGIVDALVEHGLLVVGVARRVEMIQAKAEELKKLGKKGQLHAVKADMSREQDILGIFEWTGRNLGPVSILINNAGVTQESHLYQVPTSTIKRTFDVNVVGLCIATREAVKIMRDNAINGHIIHVNSIFGHMITRFPGMNVYPATKHAVTALTETLRVELATIGSKIKITDISPGFVASEMTTLNPANTEERQGAMDQFPILQPEDIADGVVYVLSTPEHVQVHEMIIKPVGEMF